MGVTTYATSNAASSVTAPIITTAPASRVPSAASRRSPWALVAGVVAYLMWWVLDDLLLVGPMLASVHVVGAPRAWVIWIGLYIGGGYLLSAAAVRVVARSPRFAPPERDPVANWCRRARWWAAWSVGTVVLGPPVTVGLLAARAPGLAWRRNAVAASVLYAVVYVSLYTGALYALLTR